MLARLAENLFWAGRYAERAEDTARLVDVTYHTLLESTEADESIAWRQVLEVLHLTGPFETSGAPLERAEVIRFLLVDGTNPGSVVSSVQRARENLRSVRELVSSELWEAANQLHLELRARDVSADLQQPYELCGVVKRGGQTITGVAAETMPRDDGWRFLSLGRMLERAEMTCRLLDVRFDAIVDQPSALGFHAWIAILKSVSAAEAFRRTYRSSMDPEHVLEFLLLAPQFPRSVLFCLQAAESYLQQVEAADRQGRARRQLGQVRSTVEFAHAGELLAAGLHGFLEDLLDGIARVSDAVADEFFRHTPAGGLHIVAAN
ncbi:MAG: alpha-E domain-containing protein [Nitriliruptorales bacterium]|nr:alpha-E domain-containing protein [Nitriliruptorales bacterium]